MCPSLQEGRARALADQLAPLIEAAVRPGDDPRVGPRLALTNLEAFALAAQRVACEYGVGKDELVIAEVRDERSERRVVNADADHQAEREAAIDQRLAAL